MTLEDERDELLSEIQPIAERIRHHFRPGIGYHELIRLVFPAEHFPRAFEYQSNGGPPGCAMAFGKALRRVGLMRSDRMGQDVICKRDGCDW